MITRPLLISLAGLATGGLAAWWIDGPAVSKAGFSPAAEGASGRHSGPDSGVDRDAVEAWRSLTADGGQGFSVHLAQADLISRTSVRDIPRLLELTGGDPAARELLWRHWVELDPAGAAGSLAPAMRKGWPTDQQRQDAEIIFSAWGKKNPQAAMSWIRDNSPTGDSNSYAGAAMQRLLKEDMAAGVRFGALTGSSMTLTQTFYNMGSSEWVNQDPAKAVALLSALPPGEFRNQSLLGTINALAKTDLPAAIALKEKFPNLETGSPGIMNQSGFYSAWAAKDLEGFTAFVNEKSDTNARQEMKTAIAKAMAVTDPREALAWSATNLTGSQRSDAVSDILSRLSRDDPAAALNYLDSLSTGTALNKAVETFAKSLPEDDPDAALTLAESLPAGAAREALTAKAYENLYAKDPVAMLKNLAAQPVGSLPEGIWTQLGNRTGSIADGVARLNEIPPDSASDFISGVFQKNIDSNDTLQKFTEAMATLTAPDLRKAAIEASVRFMLWRGAGSVTEWAKSLPPEERNTVADQIEKHYWNLTPLQREELIQPLR